MPTPGRRAAWEGGLLAAVKHLGPGQRSALPAGEVESVTKEKGNDGLQLFDGGGGLGAGGGKTRHFSSCEVLMTGRWQGIYV